MSTPNSANIAPPQPPPLHVQYPSIPPPPKSGNTAPSQSGANAPTFLKVQDNRKVYSVRGVTFEVDQHYELIKAIGLGAYGLVCSAVDLRWVPDSPFFDKEMVDREMHGGGNIRGADGSVHQYQPKKGSSSSSKEKDHDRGENNGGGAGPKELVPTLRYEGYTRGKLSNGMPSPYVAIKKVPKLFNDLIDGKRVLREVKILQYLKGHENIVRIHDLLYPRQSVETFRDLYLVSELLDTDLHLVLKSRQPLEEDHLRFIIFQLVKSLVYIHSSGIIHRDLKPGNLLLTGSCELKVCDFGLARGGIPMPLPRGSSMNKSASNVQQQGKMGHLGAPQAPMLTASPVLDQLSTKKASSGIQFEKSVDTTALSTQVGGGGSNNNNNNPSSNGNHDHHGALDLTDYVITRYYRPPELLIMSHYHHAVDMWSVGCILAEIILHKPAFPGKDYLSQLTLIAQTQGLPCMPKVPDQIDQYFVGGTEGKNYLKDLLFGKGRRGRGGGGSSPSTATVSPAQGDLQASAGIDNTVAGLTKAHLDQLRNSLFGPDGHRYISDQAMQFLAPTLSFDPAQRPTALQALRHPYFAKMYHPDDEIWKEGPSTKAEMAAAANGGGNSPNTAAMGATPKTATAKDAQPPAPSWITKHPKIGVCPANENGPAVPLSSNNSATNIVAVDYESEEDESTAMWAFDHKELNETDLRKLFWGEMERFQRRRIRTRDTRQRNAKAAAAAAAAAGEGNGMRKAPSNVATRTQTTSSQPGEGGNSSSTAPVPTPPSGGSPHQGGRRTRESSVN